MVLSAREMLKEVYKDSKNFMTPYIETRGKISKDKAFELSRGIDFEGFNMYGVSVVVFDKRKKKVVRSGESKSFIGEFAYNDAKYYIECLKANREYIECLDV